MRRGRGTRSAYRMLRPPERRAIEAQLREGARVREITERFGCLATTVRRIRDLASVRRRRVEHSRLRLGFEERERISRGLAAGLSARRIARELGRAPSTVSREIERSGGRRRYRALAAERAAQTRLPGPKAGKLSGSPRLRAAVEAGLGRHWSPQQISARLKVEHPEDPEMRISHETIYQSLYVQSRGELRRQLAANLRRGRGRRARTRGRAPGADRRHGVDLRATAGGPDRAVPGHWEGDLLVGKAGRSCVATLVERRTRYGMLARQGGERKSAHVTTALAELIARLPVHLALSLTWDQGTELAEHLSFTAETGVAVYFCDPHSPWQRGSNENTNGLLRQYLPKGADLAARSQVEHDAIASELNGRPRQTLGWATPAEKMEERLR